MKRQVKIWSYEESGYTYTVGLNSEDKLHYSIILAINPSSLPHQLWLSGQWWRRNLCSRGMTPSPQRLPAFQHVSVPNSLGTAMRSNRLGGGSLAERYRDWYIHFGSIPCHQEPLAVAAMNLRNIALDACMSVSGYIYKRKRKHMMDVR